MYTPPTMAARLFHALLMLSSLARVHPQDCTSYFERYLGYAVPRQRSNAVLQSIDLPPPPQGDIIAICSFECKRNASCAAFSIDMATEKPVCTTYGLSVPTDGEQFMLNWLLPTPQHAVFRKICLDASASASCMLSNTWQFDLLLGWTMRSPRLTTKFLHVTSIQRCLDACATEAAFVCRSGVFDRRTRNCYLSKYDRRSLPPRVLNIPGLDDFHSGDPLEVYFENHCSADFHTSCEYEPIDGIAMLYNWHIEPGVATLSACRDFCLGYRQFPCRAFIFNETNFFCHLTSEDSYSMATETTADTAVKTYWQLRECIEVTMDCATDEMVAQFNMNREFAGKLYAIGASRTCMYDIRGEYVFNISIPLADTSKCAIVKDADNTFATNFMMQYHDLVLTGLDRIFRFMCTFELAPQQVQNFVELRDSVVTDDPRLVSGKGDRDLPQATMRIVNGAGNAVQTADVGQVLYAEVLLDDGRPSDNGETYGIFVTNCRANVGGDADVLLIDELGCPTDTRVFEGFSPVSAASNGRLRAAFRGFRSQENSRVNVDCDVNLCLYFCEPAFCADRNGRRIQSYGRRKRDASGVGFSRRFLAQFPVHGEFSVQDSAMHVIANTSVIHYQLVKRPVGIGWAAAVQLCIAAILVGFIFLLIAVSLRLVCKRNRTRKSGVYLVDSLSPTSVRSCSSAAVQRTQSKTAIS